MPFFSQLKKNAAQFFFCQHFLSPRCVRAQVTLRPDNRVRADPGPFRRIRRLSLPQHLFAGATGSRRPRRRPFRPEAGDGLAARRRFHRGLGSGVLPARPRREGGRRCDAQLPAGQPRLPHLREQRGGRQHGAA
jgi:hypothetical protein